MRGWFGSRFSTGLRRCTSPFRLALFLPWGQPPTSLGASLFCNLQPLMVHRDF